MNSYMSSSELKQTAKGQLYGRVGTVIGAFLVHMAVYLFIAYFIEYIGTSTILGVTLYFTATLILELFISVFTAGEDYIYLNLASGGEIAVSDVFYGFKGIAGKVILVRLIPVTVSTLLEIPGFLLMQLISEAMPDTMTMLQMLQNGKIDEIVQLSYDLFPLTSLNMIVLVFQTVLTLAVDVIFSQSIFFMLDYPDYSVWDTIKNSIKILKGNWGRYLYVKLSFIPWHILSILTFYISLLYSFPYQKSTMANFYLDVIKNYDTNNE